jgi:hypothetical protein
MSYSMQGFGVDAAGCAPGTLLNLDTMKCEPGTPGPSSVPSAPRTPPPSAAQQHASMTAANGGGVSGMLPWLLGGIAVVVGVLLVRSAGQS